MEENKKPSFLDDLSHEKPESFKEEVFYRQKKNYIPTILLMSVILIVGTILLILFTKGSEVPDMMTWTEGEVYHWASTNHATILKVEDFSVEVDSGSVMAQDLPEGTKLKRNGTLKVTFSKGPNPDEAIDFPDLKALNLTQINDWIATNKLTGISIKKEYNSVFELDSVINYEMVDGQESNFLRKSRVKIYVSLGPEGLTDTITIPDFSGKTKADVAKWGESNGITVNFVEDFNEYLEYGTVASQSIEANTKMKRTDVLDIVLSLGRPITVPNLVGLKRTEATDLATLTGFPIRFVNEISSKPEGTVLSQDIEAATLINTKQVVTVTIATPSDTVLIPDFVGLTSSEASTLASLSNIKTFFVTQVSTEKSGIVISQSVDAGKTINKERLVTIYVSSGDLLVPDFSGIKKEDASDIATVMGLTLIFKEIPSTTIENDIILSQNVLSGTIVENTAKITLEVAANNGHVVPDLSLFTKQDADLWSQLYSTPIIYIDIYSDTVAQGKLTKQNYIDSYIPKGKSLVIYQSLGKVPVENFIGKSKIEVLNWQKSVNDHSANITIDFKTTQDSTKTAGTVVDQSIKSDLINTRSTVTVWIAGESSKNTIPDMTGIDEATIVNWCTTNSIPYIITDQYSDTYAKDKIFGQNFKNQTLPDGEKLEFYRSLGQLSIDNFLGKDKKDIESWKNDANIKGANITIMYTLSPTLAYKEDYIISCSHLNNIVKIGSTINVTLATPQVKQVPSLNRLYISDAIRTLDSLKINYTINYQYVSGNDINLYPINTVISQSRTAGEQIQYNETLTLTVSLGKQ